MGLLNCLLLAEHFVSVPFVTVVVLGLFGVGLIFSLVGSYTTFLANLVCSYCIISIVEFGGVT